MPWWCEQIKEAGDQLTNDPLIMVWGFWWHQLTTLWWEVMRTLIRRRQRLVRALLLGLILTWWWQEMTCRLMKQTVVSVTDRRGMVGEMWWQVIWISDWWLQVMSWWQVMWVSDWWLQVMLYHLNCWTLQWESTRPTWVVLGNRSLAHLHLVLPRLTSLTCDGTEVKPLGKAVNPRWYQAILFHGIPYQDSTH